MGHDLLSSSSATCGPPLPINNRIRIKLLISDELRKRKGLGTTQDRTEKRLERLAMNR